MFLTPYKRYKDNTINSIVHRDDPVYRRTTSAVAKPSWSTQKQKKGLCSVIINARRRSASIRCSSGARSKRNAWITLRDSTKYMNAVTLADTCHRPKFNNYARCAHLIFKGASSQKWPCGTCRVRVISELSSIQRLSSIVPNFKIIKSSRYHIPSVNKNKYSRSQ